MKYRVKELARQKGMTQVDLAIKAGVSVTLVQRLWQNRVPDGVRYNSLTAVAAALGVHVDDLKAEPEDAPESATLRVNRPSLTAATA